MSTKRKLTLGAGKHLVAEGGEEDEGNVFPGRVHVMEIHVGELPPVEVQEVPQETMPPHLRLYKPPKRTRDKPITPEARLVTRCIDSRPAHQIGDVVTVKERPLP